MKEKIRKLIPKSWLLFYHKALAVLAAVGFGFPSRKLIVIGVTGTKGKTTTCNLIAKILEGAGNKVGMATTANFKIGKKEWVNDKKQTMLGRFSLQGLLWKMAGAECQYAIVEVTSEGIAQSRHWGINFDVVVFTNLTPEHIESHGSFENYKQAKGKLFEYLTSQKNKIIAGQKIAKTIVANIDDEHADYFLKFPADKKITYSLNDTLDNGADLKAVNIVVTQSGVQFDINQVHFSSPLLGRFNIYNLLAGIAVAQALGSSFEEISDTIKKISGVPGRMEVINEGQNFTVIVDYAHEPVSAGEAYKTVQGFGDKKIISVIGSQGGGRDQAKRPILGKLAAKYADCVIVTNEDPYDDDPQEIIDEVATGAAQVGKILQKDLFKILDRQEGIKKALSLAQADDVVLIMGKGSEPVMAVAGGQHIPWDDRQVTRELLKGL